MKGFKSVQEAIFTISVVLIVAVSVVMTHVYLQSIQIPDRFENHIAGDTKEISSWFAKYAITCYRAHKPLEPAREDCYVLHIKTKDTLTKKHVLDKIPQNLVPHEYIEFSGKGRYLAKKNTNTTFKITYDGFKNKLEITKIDDTL
ncbi:MAG: hypothetical protein U9Q92_00295 [archaeon]|nr:hypothetical protein [archaeon]